MTIIKNLKIQKLVFQGYGLGFDQSNTYFVQNALPGDILEVEVLYLKSKSYFCRILSIIKPSPLRKQIRCSVSSKCGACDWVDIDYQRQLEFKNLFIQDIFYSIKDLINIPQINASPIIDNYRNKSILPVQFINKKLVIGMYERQSHNVIEHNQCFLHPPIFDKILEDIKNWIIKANVKIYNEASKRGNLRYIGLRCNSDLNNILIIIITKTSKLPFTQQLVNSITQKYKQITGIVHNINEAANNVIFGDKEKILFGNDYYHECFDNVRFKINYKAFFQVNVEQAKQIYNKIKHFVDNQSVILDAYSGTGSIGIFLADKAKKLIFVESNTQAHNSAIENSKLNNVTNAVFYNNEVDDVIEEIINKYDLNTIIFDPPRKGLNNNTIEMVCKKNISKIIYLSCNPTTQIRDIKAFIQNNYTIKDIYIYDMFPHTFHIESLVILEKT